MGVVAAALMGWFAQPLLLALMMPLVLIYYLSVGARHRLAWHLALLGGLLGAVAVNSFWLIDWISYWWIRVPAHFETPLLTELTLWNVWESPFWGGPVDKVLTCVLVITSAIGVLLYNQSGRRAIARVFGLSVAVFLSLSVLGLTWEPLGRYGAQRLLVTASLFATLPTAHALTVAFAACWRQQFCRWASLVVAATVVALLWRAPPPALASWATRFMNKEVFRLGLDPDQQGILDALQQHTTSEARILWEDRAASQTSPHWTPLLPLLTQRSFIGGMDADIRIEHTTNGLADALLMARPIREWSNDALVEYCKRYNIGWIVCWSQGAIERLRDWPPAIRTATLPPSAAGESPGCLFTIRREGYSFALTGSARWLSADPQRIVLGDVVSQSRGSDNHGRKPVLLSLHYQAGMRVAPSRVVLDSCSIEPVNSVPGDARPFVRLWVDELVTRVTITWDKR
jgi:hypothetical protein